jgi:hypothetical protein
VSNWINMVFYQATWIAAVAGAGNGRWWPGLVVLLAFAVWQLSVSPWRRADIVLAVAVSVIGFGIDSLFLQRGLVHFSAPDAWPDVAPLWMIALWTSFALALNHSLAFLQERPLLAAWLGFIGAPLAYWVAGNGWHALSFGSRPFWSMALIAIAWAGLMPLFAHLAHAWRRFDAPMRRSLAGSA